MGPSKLTLITGAGGFVGRSICERMREAGVPFLGLDHHFNSNAALDLRGCDISEPAVIDQIFRDHPIGTVLHLAAVLPSTASANPELATRVNIGASTHLLETAVQSGVQRFIFASSMSVYGAFGSKHVFTEQDLTAPIDLYGTAKRYVELYGERAAARAELDFVSLRIAGVIGAGSGSQTSAWRSEIFEKLNTGSPQTISLPFRPESVLSLVHVDDLADMLVLLARAPTLPSVIYNTPAENWPIEQVKARLETLDQNVQVEIPSTGGKPAPPLSDGALFCRDFGYALPPLDLRLRRAAGHGR